MGYYINPKDSSKEDWLAKNGTLLHAAPERNEENGELAVCLVGNGGFTAAGVAVDQRELEAFAHPCGRPKQWFRVPIRSLVEVGAIDDGMAAKLHDGE